MVGEDENNLDIFKITKGAKDVSYSKRCIFDPALDMKWSFGCHPQYGEGLLRGVPGVVESADTEILMYHYKYINLQYVFDRHDSYNKRLSDFNKAYKLGVHYSYEKNKIREEYASILNEAEVVK